MKAWAWEFLRRNEQYSEFVTQMRSLPTEMFTKRTLELEDSLEHLHCNPASSEKVCTVDEYYKWCEREGIDGIVETPNDRLRLQWRISYPILPTEEYPSTPDERTSLGIELKQPLFLSSAITYVPPEWMRRDDGKFDADEVSTGDASLHQHEILIQFQLNASIADQLRRAELFLNKIQHRYRQRVKANPLHTVPGTKQESQSGSKSTPMRIEPLARIDDKHFHYLLRIYDAVHDTQDSEKILTDDLVTKLKKHFCHERDILYPNDPPHKIGSYKIPAFTKDQISAWYVRACLYIDQLGYQSIAAHRRSKRSERIRKKKVAKSLRSKAAA